MKIPEQQQRTKAAELGVPFWLEASAYEGLANLPSLQHWSWQFFRRNDEYRNFYRDRWGPFLRQESNDDPVEDLRKFGVMVAGDPTNMDVNNVGLMVTVLTEYRPAPNGMLSNYKQNPDHVFYQFDLNKSIDDQISMVRRYLRLKQDELKREFRAALSLYPKYLRVLDALDVGATQAEIAKVLSPDHSGGASYARQNVQDYKKAANHLRNKDYLALYLKAAGLNSSQNQKKTRNKIIK